MVAIEYIGKLLDADAPAETLLARFRQRIQDVADRVASVPRKPKVFIQIGVSPIVSAGTPTFINELIERAGGLNLARGKTPYPRFSREQVLMMAPEVIIITSMARMVVFEQVKAEWARWPTLPAAKNNRIYIENSNLFDRPSPRLVDGLERLAALIHPGLFGVKP